MNEHFYFRIPSGFTVKSLRALFSTSLLTLRSHQVFSELASSVWYGRKRTFKLNITPQRGLIPITYCCCVAVRVMGITSSSPQSEEEGFAIATPVERMKPVRRTINFFILHPRLSFERQFNTYLVKGYIDRIEFGFRKYCKNNKI